MVEYVFVPCFMFEGDPIELEGAFINREDAVRQIRESLEWRTPPNCDIDAVIDMFNDGQEEVTTSNEMMTIWLERLTVT